MADLREELQDLREELQDMLQAASRAFVDGDQAKGQEYIGEALRALAAQPAPSPSYDALLIIVQSLCGALDRAGITDCDDPGEAIDVMRERYEKRIAALQASQPAPSGVVDDAAERVAFEAWYVANCDDMIGSPLGSMGCNRQWRAWRARAGIAQPAPASVGADALAKGDRVIWTSCYGTQFPGEVVEKFIAYRVKLDDGTVGEYCRENSLTRLAGTGGE